MAKLPSLISKYFGIRAEGMHGAAERLHRKNLRGPSKLIPGRDYAGFVYKKVYGGAILEGTSGSSLGKTIYLPALPMIKKGPALSPEIIYAAADWYARVPKNVSHPKIHLVPSNSMVGLGTGGNYSDQYRSMHVYGRANLPILGTLTPADLRSSMSHELLHHLPRVIPGLKKQWEKIDTKNAPTDYGKTNEHEDFAESGVLHLRGEEKKLTPDRLKLIEHALKIQPMPTLKKDKKEEASAETNTLYMKGKKIWVPVKPTIHGNVEHGGDLWTRRGIFINISALPPLDDSDAKDKAEKPSSEVSSGQHEFRDRVELDRPAHLKWLQQHGYDYVYSDLTRFSSKKYTPLSKLQKGIEYAAHPEYKEPPPISGQQREQVIRKGDISAFGGLFKAPQQLKDDVYKQSFQYKTWLANTQARNLTDKKAPADLPLGGRHSFGSRWHPPEIREERETEQAASRRSPLISDPYKNIASNISAAFGKIPYDETRARLKVAKAKSRTDQMASPKWYDDPHLKRRTELRSWLNNQRKRGSGTEFEANKKIEVEAELKRELELEAARKEEKAKTKSDFMKSYWQYRKEGGQMTMAAYSREVKASLTETPNSEKPFKPAVTFESDAKKKELAAAEAKKLRTDSMATPKRKEPLEIWSTPDGSWTWEVLKKYQKPENEDKNPYARWFCNVKSPYTPDGELGDVYVKEIKKVARRKDVAAAPIEYKPSTFEMPPIRADELKKLEDDARRKAKEDADADDKESTQRQNLDKRIEYHRQTFAPKVPGYDLVGLEPPRTPRLIVSPTYKKEAAMPSEEEAEAVFHGYAGYPSNILDKEYREKELAHALKETREWTKRRHERDENAESFDFLPESFEEEPGESHGKITVSEEPEEPGSELRQGNEINSLFENRKQLGPSSEDKEGK